MDLLVSIFSIYSPLHDGAVIIQEDRIIAAKSILPLTDHPDLSPTLGTRHRAAIGLTEETDAICLAVSEETGSISIAVGGDYYGDLDVKELITLFMGTYLLVSMGGNKVTYPIFSPLSSVFRFGSLRSPTLQTDDLVTFRQTYTQIITLSREIRDTTSHYTRGVY